MRNRKDIKIVVHKPKPENAEKFMTILKEEKVRLIEALIVTPK